MQNKIGSIIEVNPSKIQHIISTWRSSLVITTSNDATVGMPQLITKKEKICITSLSG